MFRRFVALGDSTVEGLDDPHPDGGYRGWSDRLAQRIAEVEGSVTYANLGIRGRTTHQVLEEQLAPAAAMKPDLAAVVAGTNDLMRSRFDAKSVGADLETMQKTLVDLGATVITFTLPDLTPVMPLARILRRRVALLADATREASLRSGAVLCDLAVHAVATDPRLWSGDRLHANSSGHARIAHALANHLHLPGADDSWSQPLPGGHDPTFPDRIQAEAVWARDYLFPWIWRHLRGRSSGDGVAAKRPTPELMTPDSFVRTGSGTH